MTKTKRRSTLPAAVAALGLLALAAAAQQPEAPSPAPEKKITLKWTTASEVDNYGYFVWRGDDEQGPFAQMNKKVVPGAGNSDTPSNYLWEDHEVEVGKTYWYYLESVSVQGVREKFSPVMSRKCCKGLIPDEPPPSPAAAPASPAPSPALPPA